VPRLCPAPHFQCQKGVTQLLDIRGQTQQRTGNLPTIMNIKTSVNVRRATWRDRFLEIARQVEGLEVRSGAALAAGLRPRARMAGFATLRRSLAR
jgi:hypothetical protein